MPQLGETVTEGTITRWAKQVGDTVAEDEVLFEVSTDKVDSEVPSPVAGVLAEILVPEGDTVDVGTRLAVISDSAEADDRARRPLPLHRRPSPGRPRSPAGPGARGGPGRRPEPAARRRRSLRPARAEAAAAARPEPAAWAVAPEATPSAASPPSRWRRRRPPPQPRPRPTAAIPAGCSRRWCAG